MLCVMEIAFSGNVEFKITDFAAPAQAPLWPWRRRQAKPWGNSEDAMPDLASLLPLVALLLVIGGFAGIVAGRLGGGGGLALVPAFFYAFEHLGYGGPKLMQVLVCLLYTSRCV